jgi:DNA-binding NtrC family response regulator
MNALPEARDLLRRLDDPAILLSLDYEILETNGAYERVYGDGSPLAGRRCYEVSHRYDAPCDQAGETCPLQACVRTRQRAEVLHIHYTPRGEEYVNVETLPVFGDDGEIACLLEIMHSVDIARTEAHGDELVGRSPAFQRTMALVQRISRSNTNVLLLGESGTGKELVAHTIHRLSPRADGPFVPVECSGLPAQLFESELFGHARGAFTNAFRDKPGLVEAATGGTLFLDEIGDIPLADQVKILRLLETRRFRRVGDVEAKTADFRLVCATHRNLREMVERGEFREDLYYRLNVFEIELPPLRERVDDLELLIDSMITRIQPERRIGPSAAALKLLGRYGFPGNVRELKNLVERALVLCDGDELLPEHFPARCAEGGSRAQTVEAIRPLAELEADYLRRAVALHDGDRRSLAAKLGISERALYRKLSRLKRTD